MTWSSACGWTCHRQIGVAWPEGVEQLRPPEIDEKALAGLEFSEALPRHLAIAALGARLADLEQARSVLAEPCQFQQEAS